MGLTTAGRVRLQRLLERNHAAYFLPTKMVHCGFVVGQRSRFLMRTDSALQVRAAIRFYVIGGDDGEEEDIARTGYQPTSFVPNWKRQEQALTANPPLGNVSALRSWKVLNKISQAMALKT
jgi:hypothetical protein